MLMFEFRQTGRFSVYFNNSRFFVTDTSRSAVLYKWIVYNEIKTEK